MNSVSVSDSSPVREIYDLGDQPPLGVIPEKMHAFCVRQERFGEPKEAWQREIIPVPNIGPKDVMVYTMATGINYNNVWAALGYPVDVIADRQKKGEPEDFHAGGSDCAGIVWAVGSEVTKVKVVNQSTVKRSTRWTRSTSEEVNRVSRSTRSKHQHVSTRQQDQPVNISRRQTSQLSQQGQPANIWFLLP